MLAVLVWLADTKAELGARVHVVFPEPRLAGWTVRGPHLRSPEWHQENGLNRCGDESNTDVFSIFWGDEHPFASEYTDWVDIFSMNWTTRSFYVCWDFLMAPPKPFSGFELVTTLQGTFSKHLGHFRPKTSGKGLGLLHTKTRRRCFRAWTAKKQNMTLDWWLKQYPYEGWLNSHAVTSIPLHLHYITIQVH